MSPRIFRARSRIAAPVDAVWAWHTRPGALVRLIPPWQRIEVLERSGRGIEPGSRVTLRLRAGPLRRRWVAVHRDFREGRRFEDVQESGPFRHWIHTHSFDPDGPEHARLEDRIEYVPPLGPLGALFDGRLRASLERTFRYRHALLAADLARQREPGAQTLDVAVTGSSGLVGRALVAFLETAGHRVRRLVRRRPVAGAPEVHWDPATGEIDTDGLRGVDAVVHLAGESIASGRWTPKRKERIRGSRVQGTRLLAEALARMERPPRVLVSGSAIGYYGSRGDEPLVEQGTAGSDFLADLCKDWEAATQPAERSGVRVVHLRTGIVLTPAGGALAKMLPAFRLGLGGGLGGGGQYMSWIGHCELIGVIHALLFCDDVAGPVNAVAPEAVTNAEFTRTLGRVLRRPTAFPVPAVAIRVALGEMGRVALLGSQRVVPAVLQRIGFRFLHPDLETALRFELGRFDGRFPAPQFDSG